MVDVHPTTCWATHNKIARLVYQSPGDRYLVVFKPVSWQLKAITATQGLCLSSYLALKYENYTNKLYFPYNLPKQYSGLVIACNDKVINSQFDRYLSDNLISFTYNCDLPLKTATSSRGESREEGENEIKDHITKNNTISISDYSVVDTQNGRIKLEFRTTNLEAAKNLKTLVKGMNMLDYTINLSKIEFPDPLFKRQTLTISRRT